MPVTRKTTAKQNAFKNQPSCLPWPRSHLSAAFMLRYTLCFSWPQGVRSSNTWPWSKASWMIKHYGHATMAHIPRLATPPSIKLDNMAYFIPVLPWLLQLFYFFPVHYFLTPPPENSEWTQASSHCNTAAPQLRGRHGEKISHSATKRCKLWLSLCWSRTNLLWLQYKTSWKKEMWRSRSGRRK